MDEPWTNHGQTMDEPKTNENRIQINRKGKFTMIFFKKMPVEIVNRTGNLTNQINQDTLSVFKLIFRIFVPLKSCQIKSLWVVWENG